MVYIIIGVSDCGKTIVGKLLAKKLAVKFYDADDYLSQNNINIKNICVESGIY
jgi:shikimate kinase|tara:strand:+ start:290 stop:448 length:159 start_codon:yes stop_codon:yes gene_type:complete